MLGHSLKRIPMNQKTLRGTCACANGIIVLARKCRKQNDSFMQVRLHRGVLIFDNTTGNFFSGVSGRLGGKVVRMAVDNN